MRVCVCVCVCVVLEGQPCVGRATWVGSDFPHCLRNFEVGIRRPSCPHVSGNLSLDIYFRSPIDTVIETSHKHSHPKHMHHTHTHTRKCTRTPYLSFTYSNNLFPSSSLSLLTGPPPIPDSLSPIARDFLEKCFIRDPNLRPSVEELLQHPFMVEKVCGEGEGVQREGRREREGKGEKDKNELKANFLFI